jgi:hypothetical protein
MSEPAGDPISQCGLHICSQADEKMGLRPHADDSDG